MELPLDNIFPEGSSIYDFTLENKISLKELCKKYNLEIVDFSDGSQDIFLDGQKIGFWKRPKFKYKKDLTIMDKKKQLYAIIFVDCWSVFDEEE